MSYQGVLGPTQVSVQCPVGGGKVLPWMHFHGHTEVICDEWPLIFSLPRAEGGAAHFGDSAVLDWIKLIMKPHPNTEMTV